MQKQPFLIEARAAALVLVLLSVVPAAGQSELAGKWVGEEPGRNVTHPVTVELVVKGEDVTGTVSIGPDPVKTVTDGKAQGATVTFTTATRANGRDVVMTWRGELKDDRLTFTRRLEGRAEMPPLPLQRGKP